MITYKRVHLDEPKPVKVFVSFTTSENGITEKIKLVKGSKIKVCDEEALRLISTFLKYKLQQTIINQYLLVIL